MDIHKSSSTMLYCIGPVQGTAKRPQTEQTPSLPPAHLEIQQEVGHELLKPQFCRDFVADLPFHLQALGKPWRMDDS